VRGSLYRDIPDELRTLIEPVVEQHGCELVDAEVRTGHGPGVVRIVVDSAAGDGRVPVERCAQISREIETVLDAADAIRGSYRLEISSPGLDRVLAREKDFASARGKQVRLETRRPQDGRRRFRGVLVDFRDAVARLEVDGGQVEIRFEEIKRANVVYQFSRADFGRAAE
jgi:ribosome maturation factor RimP